ncbi:hypothetical protein [Conexibacter sp. SYSU D00693]|uniref:hypothetical protein n=1 Tax=Conexibacter sp. SYSU D00693 TaxID=2812560 RepID=UPI00196B7BD2|nr:hypothetical protein [Conexibacter sp. SYSU D00693]
MKVLLVLVVLLALVVVVLRLRAMLRARTDERAPWQVREVTNGNQLELWLVRGAGERMLFAGLPLQAPDFDDRLHEARAEADVRRAALQAGRPPLGR